MDLWDSDTQWLLWRISAHCKTCLHGTVSRYMIKSSAINSPNVNLSHVEKRKTKLEFA